MIYQGRSAFKSAWEERWFELVRAYDGFYDLMYKKHKNEEERGRIRITGAKICLLRSDLMEISTTSRILIVKCVDDIARKDWAKSLDFHAKREAMSLKAGMVLR